MTAHGDTGLDSRRSLTAGLLIGLGAMAAVDEIVFHQLLGWHHFYDRATPAIGLLTDGLLHAFELLAIVADRNATIDRVLTEFPPLIEHFNETQDLFVDAVLALGRVSDATHTYLGQASDPLSTNLRNLHRPLRELGRASPYLLGALKLMLTAPFNIENVPKAVRGDYINVSLTVDLTLSAIDNGILSGTGVSGMLRALEQAWGRDPATMIPDIRFTPNPHDAPGGPLVERAE